MYLMRMMKRKNKNDLRKLILHDRAVGDLKKVLINIKITRMTVRVIFIYSIYLKIKPSC